MITSPSVFQEPAPAQGGDLSHAFAVSNTNQESSSDQANALKSVSLSHLIPPPRLNLQNHAPINSDSQSAVKLDNLQAGALTEMHSKLEQCNFKRVEISGDSNRCWLRAPWFQLLNQHSNANTLDEFKAQLETEINTTDCPAVVSWREANPCAITQAIAEITAAPQSLTLDTNGRFSLAVENLLENTALAFFSNHSPANLTTFDGKAHSALDCIYNQQGGYDSFSGELMGRFGGGAAVYSESAGQHHATSELPVYWIGESSKAQTECLVYHRLTDLGHFEIMLQGDNFRPEPPHATAPNLSPAQNLSQSPIAQTQTSGIADKSVKSAAKFALINLTPATLGDNPSKKKDSASEEPIDLFSFVKKTMQNQKDPIQTKPKNTSDFE